MSVQRFGYKNGNKSQFVIKQSKMSLVTHPIKLPSHVDSPGPAGPAPAGGDVMWDMKHEISHSFHSEFFGDEIVEFRIIFSSFSHQLFN